MLAYELRVPVSYRAAFIEKITDVAAALQIDPNWLMIVIRVESAGTFDPKIQNAGSGATGLIQFLPSTARNLGTTVQALAAMTAVQQLDFVEKYFRYVNAVGRMRDVFDVYLAVFSPAFLGRPDSTVAYSSPSKAYTLNKALDGNNDGKITVGDVKLAISRFIPKGFGSGSTTNQIPVIVAVIAVVFLTYFLLKQ